MADIEVVIKISEDTYKDIIKNGFIYDEDGEEISHTIINGTPLPKDHGRLGDLDALEKEMIGGINAGLMIDGYENYSHINDTEDCLECVKYADTIIEARHPAPAKEKSKSRDDDWEK